MTNFLEGLDYVKNAVYREDLTLQSVVWVKLEFPECTKILVTNKISKEKNAKLLTDDFSLLYNGKEVVVLEVGNKPPQEIDINISEEWFFQQSCIKDYSSLELEDIQFLVQVYNRIMEG
jgi:hypothetical protein